MYKVLLVPSSDYLGHPFPQRHNQIFERVHDGENFEVHVARFRLFDQTKLSTKLVVHELTGFKVKPIAPYYLLNASRHALEIRKIIRKEGIDAIVLSNIAAPFVYAFLDSLSDMDIPMIFDLPDYYPTSAAGYLFDTKGMLGKSAEHIFGSLIRFIVRRASLVTTASFMLQEYAKKSGAQNVAYVPNGIAECFLTSYGRDYRRAFGYNEKDLVVGYIGSLEFWLDLQRLIKGAALAKKRGLSVKLLVVGGELHTKVSEKAQKWVRDEKFESETVFMDFIPHDDVPKYAAALDVGTIPFDVQNPTAYYAAPNKMWEYLSQKTPVVASPIPEAVENSDCVFTALTAEDYADVFASIASKRRIVRQKVDVGYSRALTMTWENSAQMFSRLIRSLLGEK